MRKILFLASILAMLFLFVSCTMTTPEIQLGVLEPADNLTLSFSEDVTIEWNGSIANKPDDFTGNISYTVKFGHSVDNMEVLVDNYTETSYTIDKSNLEVGSNNYWVVTANVEGLDPITVGPRKIIVENDTSNVTVTDGRGGPELTDLSFSVDGDDLLVTKEGYAKGRIQEYSSDRNYELPLRPVVNPDWTDAPKISVSGVTKDTEVASTITLDVELLTGDNESFVFYVYLGGEQRFPNENYFVYQDTATLDIDTTGFMNGETFIKILGYNNNDDSVLYYIPITINNSHSHSELPGDISALTAISYTLSDNARMYSDSNIVDSFGGELDLNSIPEDITIYNRLEWTEASNAIAYNVYRSFDGTNYNIIGSISSNNTLRYDDYSSELEVGKTTYYKVTAENSFGETDALIRKVIPVPGPEVELLTPAYMEKDVTLDATFTWQINYKGESKFNDVDESEYSIMSSYFVFWIWDLNEYNVYYNPTANPTPTTEGIYEYNLSTSTLKYGNVYSWDIQDAEISYLFEDHGANGYSAAVSIAGGSSSPDYREGSSNGEFIFTTETPDLSDTTEYKLPDLEYFNYDGLEFGNDKILVKYYDIENLERLLEKENSEIINVWEEINWASISIPEGFEVEKFIAKMMSLKEIALAQPDYKAEVPDYTTDMSKVEKIDTPTTDSLGENVDMYKLWGMKNIRADETWETTTGDPNILLAILDTGVDASHPEFDNTTFIGAYDATGEGLQDVDYGGHGTHVAGTAGANGAAGEIAGVSWDSGLMPVRVQNSNGSIFTNYLIEGTIYVADYVQAHPEYRSVINMSIGGRGYNFAMQDAIDYAVNNGVVFVTSAGNDSKRIPSFPTAYSGVIAVAATTPTNGRADFSTTGPWTSVSAPGVSIYSTVPGDGYDWMQGTSMASPHVAGAAALLLAENPNLTPMQVKNQLEETANDHGRGWTEEFGYGIIDTVAMLGELKPMKYGSLEITTNLNNVDSNYQSYYNGIISIFDSNDNLVKWGATGEYGNRIFHDLKAGDYTYRVTSLDPIFTNEYDIKEGIITITAGEKETIDLNFNIPVEIIEEYVIEDHLLDGRPDGTPVEFSLTLVEGGIYKFTTKEYQEFTDTVMYIFDVNGNMVAYNDDGSNAPYSEIIMELEAGDYTLMVNEYNDLPFAVYLDMLILTPIY